MSTMIAYTNDNIDGLNITFKSNVLASELDTLEVWLMQVHTKHKREMWEYWLGPQKETCL